MSSSEQGKLSDDDRSLISKCAEKSTDKPLVRIKLSNHFLSVITPILTVSSFRNPPVRSLSTLKSPSTKYRMKQVIALCPQLKRSRNSSLRLRSRPLNNPLNKRSSSLRLRCRLSKPLTKWKRSSSLWLKSRMRNPLTKLKRKSSLCSRCRPSKPVLKRSRSSSLCLRSRPNNPVPKKKRRNRISLRRWLLVMQTSFYRQWRRKIPSCKSTWKRFKMQSCTLCQIRSPKSFTCRHLSPPLLKDNSFFTDQWL